MGIFDSQKFSKDVTKLLSQVKTLTYRIEDLENPSSQSTVATLNVTDAQTILDENGLSVNGSPIISGGQVVTDLINATLNTATAQILGEYSFGSSGAIAINTDADNGVWISPTGILAKSAGVTTLSIPIAGNPTFKGTVLAGAVIACDIIGVNVTAKNGSTGSNIKMDTSDGTLKFSYGGVQYGSVRADSSLNMVYGASNTHFFFDQSSNYLGKIFRASSTDFGIELPGGAQLQFQSGRNFKDIGSAIEINGDFVNKENRTKSLGYYDNGEWGHLYCRQGHFSNDAWADNWYTNSDRKLKKDVRDLDKKESLDILKRLSGKRYKMVDESKGSEDRIGLIAQDVALVIPEIVTTKRTLIKGREEDGTAIEEEDDTMAINYIGLIPYLIEAIKELNDKISKK